MVDEHYYNSPSWFLQNNSRYDSYDRNGPKVFLGEYASQDAKFANSLAEAAYMTGLERNADVVKMASYAPLLANIDNVQWRPDMIWFDNDESWGSTSYQMQKLFMNNVGDRVVPSTATGGRSTPQPITGAIGLSTWGTAATYDDVKVTGPDGTALFADDFDDGNADGWTAVPAARHVDGGDGAYAQTDTAPRTPWSRPAVTATDYDYTLKATKKAGAEGFLVAFGVQETGNFYWWNLGGWNNTQGAVEKAHRRPRSRSLTKPDTVNTGQTYDLKIQVRGTKVTLLPRRRGVGQLRRQPVTEPFAQVVTRRQDRRTDRQGGQRAGHAGRHQDRPRWPQGRADGTDDGHGRRPGRAEHPHGRADPAGDQHDPAASRPTFTREFPANSVTFLRIQTR